MTLPTRSREQTAVLRERSGRPSGGTAVREVERLQLTLRAALDSLRHGDTVHAQQLVREALALRPGQPQAKNLMALTFFYDGAWDSACDIFDGLARRNGDAVALRVNAGLSALKSGRLDVAVGHLQRAIDLDPVHRRAFGYLALIHLEMGDLDLARAALLEAELVDLAEAVAAARGVGAELPQQIWEGIAKMPIARGIGAPTVDLLEEFVEVQWPPPEGLGECLAPNAGSERSMRPSAGWDAPTTEKTLERPERVEATAMGCGDPEDADPDAVVSLDDDEPAAHVPPEESASRSSVREASGVRDPVHGAIPLVEGSLSQQQPLIDTDQGWLRLWPRGGRRGCPVIIRGDLLVSARGAVSFDAVERRAKGQKTGPFEINGAPLWLLSGEGEAEARVPVGTSVTVLELAHRDTVLYLREEALGAFSGTLHWENGELPDRVPSVRFCGTGPVAVAHTGELHRLELGGEAPVLVRRDVLCGWIGEVVVSWAGISAPEGLRLYRCEGRGTALVDCGGMGRGRSDAPMNR